jgi:hypothetical protein
MGGEPRQPPSKSAVPATEKTIQPREGIRTVVTHIRALLPRRPIMRTYLHRGRHRISSRWPGQITVYHWTGHVRQLPDSRSIGDFTTVLTRVEVTG